MKQAFQTAKLLTFISTQIFGKLAFNNRAYFNYFMTINLCYNYHKLLETYD